MNSAIATTMDKPFRKPAISNGVMAMGILIATEVMFFSGLISSFLVARAKAGTWPPLGQPRLPIEATAINTLVLLASGLCLWFTNHTISQSKKKKIAWIALTLGCIFLLVQGFEWIKLINFGLTTVANLYGAYFYLLVGAHALHAMIGIGLLSWYVVKLSNQPADFSSWKVLSLYWYFVVLLWPVVYGLVYLS